MPGGRAHSHSRKASDVVQFGLSRICTRRRGSYLCQSAGPILR